MMRKRMLFYALVCILLMMTWTGRASAAELLKYGSRGTAVKTMQQKLIQLGYLKGAADGIFGSATQNAVKSFQKAKGLAVDGIAGPKTLEALYGSQKGSSGSTGSTGNTGTSSGGSTSAIKRTLKKGSRGDDVKTLQNQLNKLGYSCGKADGIFGNATLAAVKAFQKANKLTADGIVGPKTLAKLFPSSGSNPSTPPKQEEPKKPEEPKNPSTPKEPVAPITRTLKKGSRGDDVKALQNQLNKLGYSCGKADGIFGNATLAAVKAFQKANKLTADGIVGPKTLAKLFPSSGSNPSTPPKQEEPKKPEEPTKPSTPKEEPSVPITRTLRYGSRGDDVKVLQNQLNKLGYSCGKADGIFGNATLAAVKAFQKANKLTVDGIVGAKTLAKLFPSSGSNPSTPPKQEEPKDTLVKAKGIPNSLKGKTIILDAGHGGSETGAVHQGIVERDLNLDMTKRLARVLKEAGANVLLTRSEDVTVSLFHRSAYVNTYVLNLELNRLNKEKEAVSKEIADLEASKAAKDSQGQAAYKAILPHLPQGWPQVLDWKESGLSQKLQQQKTAFTATHNQAVQEYEADKAAYETAKEEYNRLNGELKALEDQLATAEDQLEVLQGLEANLRELQENGASQEEIDAAQAELDNKVAEYGADSSQLETKITQLQGQVGDAEQAVADAKKAMDSAKGEMDQAEAAKNEAKKALDNLNKVIQIAGEIAGLDNSIAQKSTAMSQLTASIADVKDKIAQFKPYMDNRTLSARQGIYAFASGNVANSKLKEVFELTKNGYQDDILFISIHCNGTSSPIPSGPQVYYLDYNDPPGWGTYYYKNYYTGYPGSKRERLASKLLASLNAGTPFGKNPKPQSKDYSILRENNLVSALVEVAYMSNPSDLSLLLKEQTREDVVAAIYKGIMEYFK